MPHESQVVPELEARGDGKDKGSVGVAALCMHGNAGVNITDGKSLGMIRAYSRTTKKNYNNENELKPLTNIQWETMAQVVAEICQAYNIPVDSSVTDTLYPYTTAYGVLAHGEVDKYGGPNQGGMGILPDSPPLDSLLFFVRTSIEFPV